MTNDRLHELLKRAQGAIAQSMATAPATLILLAAAAGLSPQDAKAWGTQYEYIGRQIGNELGRAAGGGNTTSRVVGLIGEAVGSAVGRPMDAAAQAEQQRKRDQEQDAMRAKNEMDRARLQADRDAAYEARRRSLDSSYSPATIKFLAASTAYSDGSSYANLAAQSSGANRRYTDIRGVTEIGADGAVIMPLPRQR